MCGIAGFIDLGSRDMRATCRRMTDAIRHRGPDDSGHWFDRQAGVALGHRRLSILDVSPAGHQPMESPDGSLAIVFNGEIYNHLDIRGELERKLGTVAWRGHSDTETLLLAIETWGAAAALQRCVGMFAFALWDRVRRRLILARDRIGEKPLYYGKLAGAFVFASELKALRAHPAFDGRLDHDSIAMFLRHCYIPESRSIFWNVDKVPPGTIVEVDQSGQCGEATAYWTAAEAVDSGRHRPFNGDDTEAVNRLECLLGEAVGLQMVADVPVGAFLSGGIDSSLVVAMMQARGSGRVRTFTVGFAEKEYDESPHARAVAQHLGTEHTEIVVSPAEAMEAIARLPSMYDEPFGDSSQIPTYLVSSLARRHVAVSLSGDAGDELFGGYTRYAVAQRAWTSMSRIPSPLRKILPRVIRSRPADWWTRYLQIAAPLLPRRWRGANLGHKMYRMADLVGAAPWELYHGVVSHWTDPAAMVIGCTGLDSPVERLMSQEISLSYREQMMYWDLLTYLPGDILVKVDRAAMAVSLETRVPLLDHRLVEFAWSLPMHMKVRDGQSKWLLRQLLNRYVPRELTDRPKVGFGIPVGAWLRGPLRDWAEALLDESRIRREGILKPAPIRQRWHEHLAGSSDWSYLLWDVLMFQAWLEAQQEPVAARIASAGT